MPLIDSNTGATTDVFTAYFYTYQYLHIYPVIILMALDVFGHTARRDISNKLGFGIVFIAIIIINRYIEINRRKK